MLSNLSTALLYESARFYPLILCTFECLNKEINNKTTRDPAWLQTLIEDIYDNQKTRHLGYSELKNILRYEISVFLASNETIFAYRLTDHGIQKYDFKIGMPVSNQSWISLNVNTLFICGGVLD